MDEYCLHCGYSSLAHKRGQVFAKFLIDRAVCHDRYRWLAGDRTAHMDKEPCDNYERDNLRYLEDKWVSNTLS